MAAPPQEGGLDPLAELGAWIEDARERGLTDPAALSFVTVGEDGRPSARTVTLKRIEPIALILTSALWTRKARELEANPHVAMLFFWSALGRQVHVTGTAAVAERRLAEELFARRDPLHRLQSTVSRQGEPIDADELETTRDRLAHLAEVEEAPACPEDWGTPCGSAPRRSSSGTNPRTACTSAASSPVPTDPGGSNSWRPSPRLVLVVRIPQPRRRPVHRKGPGPGFHLDAASW